MPVVQPIEATLNAVAEVLSLDGAEADESCSGQGIRPFSLPTCNRPRNIFGRPEEDALIESK
jgi:hypothetical protein